MCIHFVLFFKYAVLKFKLESIFNEFSNSIEWYIFFDLLAFWSLAGFFRTSAIGSGWLEELRMKLQKARHFVSVSEPNFNAWSIWFCTVSKQCIYERTSEVNNLVAAEHPFLHIGAELYYHFLKSIFQLFGVEWYQVKSNNK